MTEPYITEIDSKHLMVTDSTTGIVLSLSEWQEHILAILVNSTSFGHFLVNVILVIYQQTLGGLIEGKDQEVLELTGLTYDDLMSRITAICDRIKKHENSKKQQDQSNGSKN